MRLSILLALWLLNTPVLAEPLAHVAPGSSLACSNGVCNPDPLANWTYRSAPNDTNFLYAVTYAQGKFVAVGATAFLYSTDGSNWCSGDFGGVTPDAAYSVSWTPAGFIAPGKGGWINISTNGTNWSRILAPTNATLSGVAYGKDTYVITGDALLTSPDAANWTIHAVTNAPSPPETVTFLNGCFWGCAPYGLMRSTNGASWSGHSTNYWTQISAITYGKGSYVAVGYSSSPGGTMGGPLIINSQDGLHWRLSPLELEGDMLRLHSVVYAAGRFVAVGGFGALLTSTDGLTWNVRSLGFYVGLMSICYGNGTFVAVGPYGTIFQSDPIVNLELTTTPPRLSLEGPSGQFCQIEYSEVLATNQTWSPLATVALTNTPVSVDLESPASAPRRFYRAMLLP